MAHIATRRCTTFKDIGFVYTITKTLMPQGIYDFLIPSGKSQLLIGESFPKK